MNRKAVAKPNQKGRLPSFKDQVRTCSPQATHSSGGGANTGENEGPYTAVALPVASVQFYRSRDTESSTARGSRTTVSSGERKHLIWAGALVISVAVVAGIVAAVLFAGNGSSPTQSSAEASAQAPDTFESEPSPFPTRALEPAPIPQPTREPEPHGSQTQKPTPKPVALSTLKPEPDPTPLPVPDPTPRPVPTPLPVPDPTPSPTAPPTRKPSRPLTTSPTRMPTATPTRNKCGACSSPCELWTHSRREVGYVSGHSGVCDRCLWEDYLLSGQC